MNILLIYPRYPVTFWSFQHVLKYVSKKAAFPPLGLLTVAAMLPEDWNCRLVDLNVQALKDKDLMWADYVMISAMLIQRESIHAVLKECRSFGKKVVAGGPFVNSMPEEYAYGIDHLILNEAESTLKPFLEDLRKGQPKKIYSASEFPELVQTPIPRWDLIDIRNYVTLSIQYSRGCPYDCEFCDITSLYGRRPRPKRAEQFIRELQAIYDRGWRGTIFIVDDNFIGNRKEVRQLLREVISWMRIHDYPFGFVTETSIHLADDDETIHLMTEAGFDSVFIGLETPNEESLLECSKNHNCRRDMVAAIKKLQSAGLQVLGGYIVGFDHDDETIFSKQIKFIQETGVVAAMVGLLNALPGTRLWQRLKKENRLEGNASGSNTELNFIPKMDREKLIEGYRMLVRTIYTPRNLYQRICNFLDHYKPHPYKRKGMSTAYKIAFLKSLFYNGVLGSGPSQWYYWKTLIKTVLQYPDSFPEAMALTIFGDHFRKIARGI
ncbi:MAG: B12-binding domain-containing radical SAM protein [Syntrophales bacterium]